MNILSKVFCRVFQFCFHLALPVLPYREPKIYNSINDVAKILNELKIKLVLLVTDRGLRSVGCTASLEASRQKNGIICAVYDKTNANPTVHNVEDAREVYIKEKCEGLIAFGGGSSMDSGAVLLQSFR